MSFWVGTEPNASRFEPLCRAAVNGVLETLYDEWCLKAENFEQKRLKGAISRRMANGATATGRSIRKAVSARHRKLTPNDLGDPDVKTRAIVATYREELKQEGKSTSIARDVCRKMDSLKSKPPSGTQWGRQCKSWNDAYSKHASAVKTWITRARIVESLHV